MGMSPQLHTTALSPPPPSAVAGNRLLQGRGNPGTHDVALGRQTLQAMLRPAGPGEGPATASLLCPYGAARQALMHLRPDRICLATWADGMRHAAMCRTPDSELAALRESVPGGLPGAAGAPPRRRPLWRCRATTSPRSRGRGTACQQSSGPSCGRRCTSCSLARVAQTPKDGTSPALGHTLPHPISEPVATQRKEPVSVP